MFAKTVKIGFSLAVLQLLGACTTMPSGPSVMALPGTGKSFDQFRYDDVDCRQFAAAQTGSPNPNDAAVDSGVRSAALGTLLGAAAGAAVDGGSGAGVGAGVGLAMGGLAGTSSGTYSGYEVQRRYDHGYLQCMYAKGHRVPVSGYSSGDSGSEHRSNGPPPPNAKAPPPGAMPPPPSY